MSNEQQRHDISDAVWSLLEGEVQIHQLWKRLHS